MKYKGKRYFVTGLLVVLPVLITVYLFISLFLFFDNILGRYISRFTVAALGYKIPGLGLLLFVAIIFIVGFFATNFIGRKFLRYIEKVWFKFPFVRKIYPAAKQITEFLFSQKIHGKLQKVVLVEYPRKGMYSLGFVTNQAAADIQQKTGQDLLNVLIPSVPNPITGMMVVVPKDEVIVLDISIENAIKIIVSGGVLNPTDLPKEPPAISSKN